MSQAEHRAWTSPEGAALVLRLVDEAVQEGRYSRPSRRLVFQSREGETVAAAKVPLLFSLELAAPGEIEDFWRRAHRP